MPLRDLAVAGMILAILPFVLRHAYIGVLLWTWISIMNPHKLAFSFVVNAPFAAMAAGATLISLFTTKDRVELPRNAIVFVLVLFVVWMCVTTAFAIFPGDSVSQLNKVFKIQLMTLVAMVVLFSREHIRLFIWINVLSLGFYGGKGGLFTLTSGGENRVFGPPAGFIEGNNELALALIIIIPLMNYLRLTSPYRFVRGGIVFVMIMSAFAALGTQSRGALLAIVAMGALLWWRAPGKIVTGAGLALVAAALFMFMPQKWADRMYTIANYEQDGSAMARLNAWTTMTRLANDRLVGGGFEVYNSTVYNRYAPDPEVPRAAHSIYFQVLGEHGYIGLFLFLLIWFLAWHNASVLRVRARASPEVAWLRHLGGMCQVSLAGYAVGGAFLSLAYFDLPYNLLVVLVVARRWADEKAWEKEVTTKVVVDKTVAMHPVTRILGWIRTA